MVEVTLEAVQQLVQSNNEVKALAFWGTLALATASAYLVGSDWVWSLFFYISFAYTAASIGRKIAKGSSCEFSPDMTGKVAIVTGGNAGIGRETVFRLIELNATVIIGARDPQRAKEAEDDVLGRISKKYGRKASKSARDRLKVIVLDLTSFESIEKFVENFSQLDVQLDLLINNAGIMMNPFQLIAPGKNPDVKVESQFLSNHLGHFYLTQLLLPKLKRALEGARIVNVSSVAHVTADNLDFEKISNKATYKPQFAYGVSKLSNILFTRELQRILNEEPDNKINVYALHPGAILTELTRHVVDNQISSTFRPLLNLVLKTPQEGCQTSLFCALDPRAVPGEYHAECSKAWSTPAARNPRLAQELWKVSENLVKSALM